MLPARHRLRRSADFTAVLHRGRRAGRTTLVVHALVPGASESPAPSSPARFGLVVGRAVGNSVVRHRVSRRLRALLASRVGRVPIGADVVVRANPAAAAATSTQLSADLDAALRRLDRAESGRAR